MRGTGLFVGLTTIDVVHVLDELPGRDEKATATAQHLAAGGPAANAALTFAALGGTARLLTVLGAHPLCRIAETDLVEHGVEIIDADPTRALPPPVSSVRLSATGERSVTSADSTGPEPEPAVVEPADVVLLDGHWRSLAMPAAEMANREGVPVVIDAGRPRPIFTELLPMADFVVASADYVRAHPQPVGEAFAATDGAGPIRWAVADERGTVDVPRVAAVDTLGAGDVFHGAVAYAVAAVGGPTALALWPAVLAFAAEVAAVRVSHLGPRKWLRDPRLSTLAHRWN